MSGNKSELTLGLITAVAASVLISLQAFATSFSTVELFDPSLSPTHTKPSPKSVYVFPNGGRKLFPAYRLIALYGTPGNKLLGALGEQSMDDTVKRVKQLSDEYQQSSPEFILPTFEIIATIAHSGPTANQDYSQEIDPNRLLPWIKAAQANGIYVVLDLQPGRTDFLTQAKMYESLLLEPNVGLALDPEWRLSPVQRHLQQIGSVDAAEINQVADWLAALAHDHKLPQKLFLLQQFKSTMITHRTELNTSHEELAYVLQMDGNGSQSSKLETWTALQRDLPAGINLGWKNFYDEDHPMASPEATLSLTPKPAYISYQ